jgi:hypothetical protein
MAHTPAKELQGRLEEASKLINVGCEYAHYKHPTLAYQVLGLGLLEADEAVAVIYQQVEGEKLTFIRPLTSFLESVETDEGTVTRFKAI